MPPGGAYADMAAVRNLRIWRGTVPPAKMRYLPALPSREEFGVPTERAADSVDLTPGCPAPPVADSVSPLDSIKNVASTANALRPEVAVPASVTNAITGLR